jgi:hypothetical protein
MADLHSNSVFPFFEGSPEGAKSPHLNFSIYQKKGRKNLGEFTKGRH